MEDITIIYLTPNLVPKQWAEYHKKVLLEAIGNTPIITISKEPLDWGTNLLQTEYSVTNIYRQILRGAKLATTPYIAIAEDDTLYPKDHFEFRPPMDKFAYNFNRWHLFTWGEPVYFHKPRAANGTLIASRELVIGAIERRFAKYDVFPRYFEKEMGTKIHSAKYDRGELLSFYSSYPVVGFCHDYSIDPRSRIHRKKIWSVQAYDIPKWGKASELRKLFV